MPNDHTNTTELLVLKKTAYSETSIILAGLCPMNGQLHFLVRGGRRLSKKRFPVADIFRVLRVTYRPKPDGLMTWNSAEMLRDYGRVAASLDCFNTAAWLARFALANTDSGVPCPSLFAALETALKRLQEAAANRRDKATACQEAKIGACVVFLEENGLLPSFSDNPASEKRRELLLEMGCGERDLKLKPEDWQRLNAWLQHRLQQGDCHIPE